MRKAVEQKPGFLKQIFYENGKMSISRFMTLCVFFSMIAFWWVSTYTTHIPPPFVQENVHTVFMTLLGYTLSIKFKTGVNDRLSGKNQNNSEEK